MKIRATIAARIVFTGMLAVGIIPFCFAQSPSAPVKSSPAKSDAGAPDPQIAAAKASGQVWVNTETGVYHKSGRWYGKTKKGKFMNEDDAKKAGFKAAQRD